jgi:hypothetical protein
MIQLDHCTEHVNRWKSVVFEFWKPPGSETETEAATAAQPRDDREMLPGVSMRIVESAGFVALVSAILYFMGYSYYAGYFERLSLPSPFPELSTTDYFLQAFSSLSGLIIAVLVSIPYRSTVPTTIWEALWVNSAFIIMPLILAQNARSNGFLGEGLALVLGVAVVAGLVASLLKLSIMKLMTARWGLAGALAYAFGFFSFFSFYFRLEGAADATRLIEGRLDGSASVVLQTKDKDTAANGVPLLVALARNGQFYLVPQASPAPEAPVVYFVPESEVRSATIHRAATAAPPHHSRHAGAALRIARYLAKYTHGGYIRWCQSLARTPATSNRRQSGDRDTRKNIE